MPAETSQLPDTDPMVPDAASLVALIDSNFPTEGRMVSPTPLGGHLSDGPTSSSTSSSDIWIAGLSRSGRSSPRRRWMKSQYPPTSPSPLGSPGLLGYFDDTFSPSPPPNPKLPPSAPSVPPLPSPPTTPSHAPSPQESVTSQYIAEHVMPRDSSRSRSKARRVNGTKGASSPIPVQNGAPVVPSLSLPGPFIQNADRFFYYLEPRIVFKELVPRVIITPKLSDNDQPRFAQLQPLALNALTGMYHVTRHNRN